MRTGGRQTFASPPPQLDRRRRHRPNPSSKSGGFGHDAATASAARACRRVAAPCARGPPRAAPEHDSPPPPPPPLAQRGVHRDPRPIHRDFRRDRVGIATLEHGLAFGGVLGVHGGLVVPGLRRSSPVVLFYAQSAHIPRIIGALCRVSDLEQNADARSRKSRSRPRSILVNKNSLQVPWGPGPNPIAHGCTSSQFQPTAAGLGAECSRLP